MPGRNPAIIANINICQFVRLRIDKTLPPGLFFEGFEKGNDEDDDDEDEGEGGKDGAGLQAFESSGPEEYGGGEGLNNAPSEFYVVWWVEAAVGGERSQHEGSGICGGDEKGAD